LRRSSPAGKFGSGDAAVGRPFFIRNIALIKAIFCDFDGVLTTDKSGSLTTLRSLSR